VRETLIDYGRATADKGQKWQQMRALFGRCRA
jgi:hypothetical protein